MPVALPHPLLHSLLDAQDNFDVVAKLLDVIYDPGDLKASAVAVTAGAEPAGWLVCDGRAVSRTSYAKLFAAIGVSYGSGNGTTTFNLPSASGRTMIGAGTGAGLTARALGAVGGAETHALAIGEMPSHDHGGATIGSGAKGPEVYGNGGNPGYLSGFAPHQWDTGGFVGNDNASQLVHSHPISAQGGGGAHNNMQPFVVVNVLIKT